MNGIQNIPVDRATAELIGNLMAWKMGISFDDLRFIYRAGYVAGSKATLREAIQELKAVSVK